MRSREKIRGTVAIFYDRDRINLRNICLNIQKNSLYMRKIISFFYRKNSIEISIHRLNEYFSQSNIRIKTLHFWKSIILAVNILYVISFLMDFGAWSWNVQLLETDRRHFRSMGDKIRDNSTEFCLIFLNSVH